MTRIITICTDFIFVAIKEIIRISRSFAFRVKDLFTFFMQINISPQFKIKLCKEKMLTRIIYFVFCSSNIWHIDVPAFQFSLYEEPIIISQIQSH